jgi:hypothetical protein
MLRLKIISLVFAAIIILSGCESNNNDFGEASFYTDAQAWLNCGAFGVHVYIDGEKKGTLINPVIGIQPDCGDSSTLTVQLQEGYHIYFAEGDCADLKWEGNFKIIQNQCKLIFLDFHEGLSD